MRELAILIFCVALLGVGFVAGQLEYDNRANAQAGFGDGIGPQMEYGQICIRLDANGGTIPVDAVIYAYDDGEEVVPCPLSGQDWQAISDFINWKLSQ